MIRDFPELVLGIEPERAPSILCRAALGVEVDVGKISLLKLAVISTSLLALAGLY